MKLFALALALAPLTGLFQDDTPKSAEPALPEVRLPVSAHAGELDGDAVVLTVLADGRVVAAGEEQRVLIDPAVDDEEQATAALRRWLSETAKAMDHAPPGKGGKISLPDDPLLLRVDVVAPFWHVQRLMEQCGTADVLIWRIDLAVVAPEGEANEVPVPFVTTTAAGAPLHAYLPIDPGIHGEDVDEKVEVSLRVVKEGRPVERDGELVQEEPRELEYRCGPRKTTDPRELAEHLRRIRSAGQPEVLTIEPHPGVTHGEVVEVLEAALDAGFESVRFLGRR